MSWCNHVVMLAWLDSDNYGMVHREDVVDYCLEAAKESADRAYQFNFCPEFLPTDYLDARKGLSDRFNYCPRCGAKILWPSIKFELKKAMKKEGYASL